MLNRVKEKRNGMAVLLLIIFELCSCAKQSNVQTSNLNLSALVDSNSSNIQYGNITTYEARGVGGGGAMSGLGISPYSSLWFVGTDMGTLFRSIDFGKTWNPISHFQTSFNPNLAESVSVGFSSDPMVVFHAQRANTAQRSQDGGLTWTRITTLNLDADEVIRYWRGDTNNQNDMYMASNKGLWKSKDKGLNWSKILSTTETSIGTFIDKNGDIYHGTESVIFKSADKGQTFSNFYKTPSEFKFKEFTAGRDQSGITFALLDNNGQAACDDVLKYTDYSKYGGDAINMSQALAQMNACGYVWVGNEKGQFTNTMKDGGANLRMAENDSQVIYVTGHNKWARQMGTKIWRTTNRGKTWDLKLHQHIWDTNPFSNWGEDRIEFSSPALDIGWDDSGYESFAINLQNSKIVGGTGYYFLFTTQNGGDFWNAPFTKYADVGPKTKGKKWQSTGLEVNSIYKLKFHPKNPQIGYAAAADIAGMATEDGGKTFRISKVKENSNYDYAFDPADDNVVYAVCGSKHDFPHNVNESHMAYKGAGGVFKSTDKGRTYKRLTPDDDQFNRQFLSLAYDASSRTMFAGSQGAGVAVSYDNGVTWNFMNEGLPYTFNIIVPQIEIDPANGDAYLLVTGDARASFRNQSRTGIYYLKKGATKWELLRKVVTMPTDVMAGVKPWFFPTGFAIDFSPGSDRSTMYLIDLENNGNWLGTGVWKTTNRGANWVRLVQYTLPTAITIDPNNSNNIYVSGKFDVDGSWGNGGALYSTDAGKTWKRNDQLPLQANGYSATLDPNDPTKMFYTFFGGTMLYGPRPK